MRQSNYLFRIRAVNIKLLGDPVFKRSLTPDTLDVLISMVMISESEGRDSMSKAVVAGVLRKYFHRYTNRKLNSLLDTLHDLNYIFIDTLDTVSITELGRKTVRDLFTICYDYEKYVTREFIKGLYTQKVSKSGILTPYKKKSRLTPYTGIKRAAKNLFFIFVKEDGRLKQIGKSDRAITAAKIRDNYIREHKLNLKYSLK